ncbi:hypothetical protein Goshw_016204, partial [Gossypium schwendimanii]|nr:hypothetical protein [Gossypium schwendimanii]
MRIFSLVDWLRCEFTKVDNEYAGSGKRVYVGRKRKREASKALELHQTVNVVVEIVKEHYL